MFVSKRQRGHRKMGNALALSMERVREVVTSKIPFQIFFIKAILKIQTLTP